ncbi:hypothetical protein QJS10_CPA06g01545 [Acorus calamus]|uniref:CCHC-type domain-containing protein n=1 Tax=Acorus calamus TaxID=4465 RepID=A0AAV9ELV5_ACOCL|nr:hypothetical protein QJS10_CPA06g01545 [Acorus calamus]
MASSPAASYLDAVNDQVWSRSQFGTGAKCNYVTNAISESFNAWINKARGLPIVEMVDMIRGKIMERMYYRNNLGRRWKGKLVPKAFKYVQILVKDIGNYIVRRIGAIPSRDQWVKVEVPFSIGPPKTVRPRGRPRKNRIRDPNEKKKRSHKCTRCKEFGHHRSSCKNPIGQSQGEEVSGRGRGRGRERGRNTRFIQREDGQGSNVNYPRTHNESNEGSTMGGSGDKGIGGTQSLWNGINIQTGGGSCVVE